MAVTSDDFYRNPQMNMTPMIDVLLVLIIIFLVIAPIPPRGLDTLVPQPDTNTERPPGSDIVITVRADHTVRLNQEQLDIATLRQRLEGLFRNRGNHVVFVRGGEGLDFQSVAEVIDLAKGAGVSRIGLMTR